MVFMNKMLVAIVATCSIKALTHRHPTHNAMVGGTGCPPHHANAGALRDPYGSGVGLRS